MLIYEALILHSALLRGRVWLKYGSYKVYISINLPLISLKLSNWRRWFLKVVFLKHIFYFLEALFLPGGPGGTTGLT